MRACISFCCHFGSESLSTFAEHPHSCAYLFSLLPRLPFPWTLAAGQVMLLPIPDKLCASLLFCLSVASLGCLHSGPCPPHLIFPQSCFRMKSSSGLKLRAVFPCLPFCHASFQGWGNRVCLVSVPGCVSLWADARPSLLGTPHCDSHHGPQ